MVIKYCISVLHPLLFLLHPVLCLLYTADVPNIIQKHGLVSHSYVDDSSIYLHLDPASCCTQLPIITACIDDISSWMFSNRLKINMDEIQFIWLGSPLQLAKLNIRTITLADVDIEVSDEVTCLSVVLDSTLTFAANVKKRVGSCFYQLQQLRAVRRTPSALITTRVDYCNSVHVLYGVTTTNLRPLQSIINAAARLITGKRKFDHITDTLVDVHWLPVRQRIQFKLCSLVSKCQRRTAPSYLADMCISVSVMSAWSHLSVFCHSL